MILSYAALLLVSCIVLSPHLCFCDPTSYGNSKVPRSPEKPDATMGYLKATALRGLGLFLCAVGSDAVRLGGIAAVSAPRVSRSPKRQFACRACAPFLSKFVRQSRPVAADVRILAVP